MTQENNFTQPILTVSLFKRLLIGATIAFVLVSIFLLGVGNPDPAWPVLWWIRPLAVISIAGAMGGVCYHFLTGLASRGGWLKALLIGLSCLVYLIGLWLGFVLGFAGTMWH